MNLLKHPLANQSRFGHRLGFRQPTERIRIGGFQLNRSTSAALKDAISDLLQFITEVDNVVCISETGQFLSGVGVAARRK